MQSALEQNDVISCILPFLSDQYLYSGGLSKNWNFVFENVIGEKRTRCLTKETTVDQLRDNLSSQKYIEDDLIQKLVNSCARMGRTDLIKFLHEKYEFVIKNTETCGYASMNGHLETLKYLRSIKSPWSAETVEYASFIGDIRIVSWCVSNGCQWNHSSLSAAATGGHLDIVKWLKRTSSKFVYPSYIATCAAISGKDGCLDVIKWAKSSSNFSWASNTYICALKGGNIDILDYINENGDPWNSLTVDFVYAYHTDTCKISDTTMGWIKDNCKIYKP
jgi:hypothetical protein